MVENPFSLGVNLQVGSGEALEANWSKLTTRNWLEIYNSDAQKFNRSRGNGVIHTVNISPFLIVRLTSSRIFLSPKDFETLSNLTRTSPFSKIIK